MRYTNAQITMRLLGNADMKVQVYVPSENGREPFIEEMWLGFAPEFTNERDFIHWLLGKIKDGL